MELIGTAKANVKYLEQLGYEVRVGEYGHEGKEFVSIQAVHRITHTLCILTYEVGHTPKGAPSMRYVDAIFPSILMAGVIPAKQFAKVAQLIPAARLQGFSNADLLNAVDVLLSRPEMCLTRIKNGDTISYTFSRGVKTGKTVDWSVPIEEF